MTKRIGILGRGLLVAACAGSAHGDVLYATRGDRLYRIDTDTVTAEEVGGIGLGTVAGMTFGTDGTLYALTAYSGLLVSVDPATAAGVVVGELGSPVSPHSGLACDPTTSMLYAISNQGAGTASFLVAFSPTTMTATPVADTAASALLGLGCDATGQLFGLDGAVGVDAVMLIDKTSGAVTELPFPLAPFNSTGSLEVGPTGRVWTVNSVGSAYELVEVDPSDGFPSSHGPIQGIHGSGVLGGLAAAPLAGLQVFPPSPGEVGVVNTVVVTGAEPGSKVVLLFGLFGGKAKVRKCSEAIEIVMPFALKVKKADDAGVVEFQVPVRKGVEGWTILLQTLEIGSCNASPVLSVSF